MPTTKDLIDDFVASRACPDPGPDDQDNREVLRTSEHHLIEVSHGEPHIVAGWEHAGSADAIIWIANEFQGWARRSLDEKLREARLDVMTVLPPDDIDDVADIMWWGYPAECMSCGETLAPEQRVLGLCTECVELRAGLEDVVSEVEPFRIQQHQGLRGALLPRTRPSS